MNPRQSLRIFTLTAIEVLSVTFAVTLIPPFNARAQTGRQTPSVSETSTSPLPTPTPTPKPISQEAQIALNYISVQHNIPTEILQIVNEHRRSYLLIGRAFKAFTIWTTDSGKFQEFNLLVDLETGAVESDVNAVAATETAAYRTKYGKLHPDLYERLQKVETDELLPIAIWLMLDPIVHTQEQVFAELVGRFPGAAEALAEKGVPWAVADTALAEEIRQAYFRILSTDAAQRMQPLVERMKSLGAEVTTFEPMPSLFARLSKPAILALVDREDVDLIYLVEGEVIPAMAEAASTDRMPATWYQGSLSGAGRHIAVLEPSNIQNTGCLNVVASRPGVPPASWTQDQIEHKTRVTSVLACNNATYRGIAYNANVIDAGYNSTNFNPDFAAGVQWAVQTQNADAVNVSLQTNTTQAMQWEDRVLDYWGRFGPAVIVVATGNDTINVISPGKGWNVITVGAIDDQGNSNWADDVMAGFSNYVNPSSTNSDHEKPDLVAPGTNITLVGPGGTLTTRSGTSYAAPQVAGLAALLMNRNGALVDRPEAVKAVLMASAAHNIQDSRWMPSGQDLRDGAGSIDAALADRTASLGYGANNNTTCDRPCWWATDTLYVAPGGSFTRSFQAGRGERIRVAIAWLSLVDPLYATDTLGVNYNLQVLAPSGGQVTDGYSASWDNSNELVEFIAPEVGTYTIRMIRSASDTSSQSTDVGIAWSKQATYLPDVRGSDSSWTSSLVVRNDGAEPRPVRVTYLLENGNFAASQDYPGQLAPNATWTTSPPSWLLQGSAIVDGSEDLSVSIATRRSDRAYGGSGINPGSVGDPAVEHAATTLYAPALYHNAWGYNSTLFIQNTGSATASGTLYLVGRARVGQPDYPSGNCPLSINPGGRIAQTPIACVSSLPSSWVGSARIVSTNNQPLAAQVLGEKSSTADARSFVATATGQTVLHLPAAYKNKWNTNSGVVVQNVGGGNSRIRLTFYDRSTGNQTTTYDFGGVYLTSGQAIGQWLPDLSLLPDGWVGSIKVESLDGQPLAAIAQVADANDVYEYTAATGSFGTTVLLPRAARYDGSKTTGYIVLNPGSSAVTVTPTYYNAAGTVAYTPTPYTLPAHASAGYHQSGDTSLPSGWTGSILLQASGPIVAVMREDDTAALSASAYNGLLR